MTEKSPLLTPNKENLDLLSQQVSAFNTAVNVLRKSCEKIATLKDTESFRIQLTQKREECGHLAKELIQTLKRVKVERSEKSRYDKLIAQYSEIFKSFKEISADSIQKEKLYAPQPEQKALTSGFSDNFQSYDEYQRQQNERRQAEESMLKLETETRNVEQQILKERHTELKKLEKELTTLNEMFVDVATMIVQQGTMIEVISDNAAKSAAQTGDAVIELKKASEYQRSSRTKLCCILLLVIIILGFVGGFLAIFFATKKIK